LFTLVFGASLRPQERRHPVNGYGRHGFFVIKNGSTLR
jgi:hypothetical protein